MTHLNEQRQDAWLQEVRRVLKPSGIMLATVHGPHCWDGLPAWTVRQIQKDGFMFARTGADEGIHRDWYQTTWHTEAYVRSHWSGFFEICDDIPRGFIDYQDMVVARKRG